MERWGDNYKLGILGVRGDGIEEWGCLRQGFGLECRQFFDIYTNLCYQRLEKTASADRET